jgi:hypothetical protein
MDGSVIDGGEIRNLGAPERQTCAATGDPCRTRIRIKMKIKIKGRKMSKSKSRIKIKTGGPPHWSYAYCYYSSAKRSRLRDTKIGPRLASEAAIGSQKSVGRFVPAPGTPGEG